MTATKRFILPLLCLAARLYLAYVFLSAALPKLLDPAAFAVDIATYQLLPLSLVNGLAIFLPWVEFITGVMLAIGLRARAAALLTGAMLLLFMGALSIALAKGLDISCGCFASGGIEHDPISWLTMVRDLFWLSLSALVLFFDRGALGLDALLVRWRTSHAI